MGGSSASSPSIVEKQPFTVAVCLESSASWAFLGSFCTFWYFVLASPKMTSVRKLVSRGAVGSAPHRRLVDDEVTGVSRTCILEPRHLLCSLQSAEPKITA